MARVITSYNAKTKIWLLLNPYFLAFLSILNADIRVHGQHIPNSPCFIPGSYLGSNIWYTIDMEGYTPGYLTWTSKPERGLGVMWHLYHVFGLNDTFSAKYKKGGEWYQSTLWQFLPSKSYPGWYKLRNARLEGCYVTWGRGEYLPTHATYASNYVVLERHRNEADYMLKPVFMESRRGIQFHRLIMRQFPQGLINWSSGGNNWHYIGNHHSDSKPVMDRYERGGDYYSYTLFMFTEADESPSKTGCAVYARNAGNIAFYSALSWLLFVCVWIF